MAGFLQFDVGVGLGAPVEGLVGVFFNEFVEHGGGFCVPFGFQEAIDEAVVGVLAVGVAEDGGPIGIFTGGVFFKMEITVTEGHEGDAFVLAEGDGFEQGFGGFLVQTIDWAPREKLLKSYELLARYVMPHFQGSVVSTAASNQWAYEHQETLMAGRTRAIDKAKADWADRPR